MFLKGLSIAIQELLVPLDLPPDLDSLIALAIGTDNRIRKFKQRRGNRPSAEKPPPALAPGWLEPLHSLPDQLPPYSTAGGTEPMQLGSADTGGVMVRTAGGPVFLLQGVK